jgi:4-hydroxy-tetrahydrodipicolinate synthase
MTKLEGVYPVLNTTFNDDGSLDLNSQVRLVDHLLEQGAHGLGLFGNASEGYALSEDERITLLHLVHKHVDGRVPIVTSTGHTGTDAAVHLSKQAEDLGASALMVLPPYFLRTDADGLMYYFGAIGKAVQVSIMIQDAPLMTQVSMSADLLARLQREIEGIRYVKVEAPPTTIKVSSIVEASQGRLTAFGGLNGLFMFEEIERGAKGVMPGSDMTSLYVRMWDRIRAGDHIEAWCLFTRALPLIRFELQPGMGVAAMKHNLVAEGVIRSARVRHPTATLSRQSLVELEFLRSWVKSEPDHFSTASVAPCTATPEMSNQ